MSFITLQSKRNEISHQALDSSYFRNDFKNGILVKPGDTISLVNLTINTAAEFIVNDLNDTIVFRLGNRTTYFQVVAKMEHGAFNGKAMESVIDTALNNAVIGGVWKRFLDGTTQYGFQTEYDKSDPGFPKFKINMVQQPQPDENLSDKNGYKTISNTLPSGNQSSTELLTSVHTPGTTPLYHIDGNFNNIRQGSTDLERGDFSLIDLGERGVFLNGGSVVMECRPVSGVDTTSASHTIATFTNLYEGGTGGLTGDVWEVIDSADNPTSWLLDNAGNQTTQVDCNVSNTGVGGWDLKLTFVHTVQDGTGGTTTTFFLHSLSHAIPGQNNGVFVMGTNSATDPDEPANWNAPIPYWYWDKDNGRLVGSPSLSQLQERLNEGNNSLISHVLKCKDPTSLITATLVSCVGYNTCRVGIARQQFYYGDKNVADEALDTSPTGTDASIGIITNTAGLIPKLDCCRIVGKQGKKFGESGWRDGNNSGRFTFPSGVGQTPSLDNASIFGSNFVPGDRIKIGVEYTGLTSFNFFIEMAKESTPDTWTPRVNIASVGRTTVPASLIHQGQTPILQSKWNIRAYSAYGGGGFYTPAHYVLKGINDRQTYNDIHTISSVEPDESLMAVEYLAPPPQPAGASTTIISELNRNSGTDANNVSQTITIPAQYTGYDVNSISLYMNNADPSASFNIVLDLYANITDATSTQIATRFSGQTPFHTTEPVNIPPSGTSARTWDIDIDTSSYSVFYIVAREVNNGSMVNLGIQGDFSSNLGGTTANMVGGLKLEVVGNTPATSVVYAPSGFSTPSPITNLNCLFKFGMVGSGDLANDMDIPPNIANANDLLGMANSKESTTLAGMFEIISTVPPVGSGTDLNMMVCLEDFNITGKNGNTGDDTKIICVVPKEQLTQSDSNVNILHYNADFPIPIDLNPATEQTYYSLTASLRDMEGKFIRSLEAPTHLTLLHERDKKSAMAEAVSNAIEKANEKRANIQSNMITNAGLNNPRV